MFKDFDITKYYKKNKYRINKTNNTKIMCVCGCSVNRSHLRSGIHKSCKKHHVLILEQITNGLKNLKKDNRNINLFS